MSEVEIKELLDQLSDIQAGLELLRAEKKTLIEQTLPKDIKEKLDEIDDEYLPKAEAIGEQISQLINKIKVETAKHGKTVRGSHLQSVWNKGRITWDDKALNGYAIDHPDIKQFRKAGNPSVAIKNVG